MDRCRNQKHQKHHGKSASGDKQSGVVTNLLRSSVLIRQLLIGDVFFDKL